MKDENNLLEILDMRNLKAFGDVRYITTDTSWVQLAKREVGQKWVGRRFPKGATEWRESGCPCQNREKGRGGGQERIWRRESPGIWRDSGETV